MLFDIFFVVLCIVLGSLAFRVRGGGFFKLNSTFLARLVWAFVLPVSTALILWSWIPLVCIPGLYLGSVFGWGTIFDLGRRGHTFKRDFSLMLIRGFIWTFPAGLTLALVYLLITFEYYIVVKALFFVFSGVMAPFLYELAWRYRGFHIDKSAIKGAEFLYGGWLGLCWGIVFFINGPVV